MAFVAVAAGIGLVGSVATTAIGANQAKKGRQAAGRDRARLERKLNDLEESRMDAINPYADAKDLSAMINDLSGNLTNTYDNLGVATMGAEIQMEQSDIALANTLDLLQATGASAGGATALAQAAIQSKKDIAAGIEQQEAANMKLRADGEANLQANKMEEAKRVQSALYGEAGRLENLRMEGVKYKYEEEDRRETDQLNRVQAQITGAAQAQSDARASEAGILSAGMQGVMGAVQSGVSAIGAADTAKKSLLAAQATAGTN